MKNIQIKMPSGEVIPVELISLFELTNIDKKYMFYTKGETVENNLIKMYTSEVLKTDETHALGDKMSDEEWDNLKNVMKSILTGNLNTNIKYIDPEGITKENIIDLKEGNVIALQQVQKEKLSDTYISAPKEKTDPEPVVEEKLSTPADVLQTEFTTPITAPPAPVVEEKPIVVPDEFKPSVSKEYLEETQSIIEKELLSIINKINVLQRDLDALGEDIIKFSNLYKVEPKQEEKVQEETVTEIPKQEEIKQVIEEPIKEEPLISNEINTENISPFSLGENQTNIFD